MDDGLGRGFNYHEYLFSRLYIVWLDELVDNYKALEKKLGFTEALPISKHWSAAADFLSIISDYCLTHKPKTIVECSSGSSSLVLAKCCQLNKHGHVTSLENGEAYVKQTNLQLLELRLSEYCDVVHAPLIDYQISDHDFQWYALNNLLETKIDMLVIDGPPGFMQRHSRYPAIPLLHNRLSEQCAIFLDDAVREDEKEIVKLWLEAYPEFEFEYVENERGCSILKR